MDTLITVMTVAIGLLTLTGMFTLIRKSLSTHIVSVQRETDNAERISFSFNFSSFDSQKTMQAKIDQACALADERRRFIHERFQAQIDAEIAKNEAAAEDKKLKSVKK